MFRQPLSVTRRKFLQTTALGATAAAEQMHHPADLGRHSPAASHQHVVVEAGANALVRIRVLWHRAARFAQRNQECLLQPAADIDLAHAGPLN